MSNRALTSITVEQVQEAYQAYRRAKTDLFEPTLIKIPMGSDGIEYADFEKEELKNARSIVRRAIEGTYRFQPLIEVHKKKPNGKIRVLSISSVRDVLLQRCLYNIIYPPIEDYFSPPDIDNCSYAYRKGRSAPKAASLIHRYIQQGYVFAMDADLSQFFDTVDHEILQVKLTRVIKDPTILRLLKKFIHSHRIAPRNYQYRRKNGLKGYNAFKVLKPRYLPRSLGIPQGGMLSGLLANLYLSDFDRWVVRELGGHLDLKYIRYADDFLIMVKQFDHLVTLKAEVALKLMEIKLHLNKEKTIIIDIKTQGLNFLGFAISSAGIAVSARNIIVFRERFLDKLSRIDTSPYTGKSTQKIVNNVVSRINFKISGFGEKRCTSCGKSTDGRPKSWVSFFSVVTDIRQLKDMDLWIRRELYNYFYREFKVSVSRQQLRSAGLMSLEQEFYRVKKIKLCRCPAEAVAEVLELP